MARSPLHPAPLCLCLLEADGASVEAGSKNKGRSGESRDGAGCSHLLEVKQDGENGGVLEAAANHRQKLEGTLEVAATLSVGWCFVLLRVHSLLHQSLSVLIKCKV